MKQVTSDKLLSAKTGLLWDHPFFGTLLLHLKLVDATDNPDINTMATDGKHLYYHEPFLEKLKKDELLFVLAHEVMHNALEHHIRRQDRNPLLWNIATDFAINLELTNCNVGKMPAGGLLSNEFAGMGAEEIYNHLLKDDAAAYANGKDPGGCGQVLDACASHDETGRANAAAEIRTAVLAAGAAAKADAERSQRPGKYPDFVKRLVDQIAAPKVNWREVLRRFIDNSSTMDYSWVNPNRRTVAHGFHSPGQRSDGVSHIAIAVDTSGSINDEILKAFAAEVNGAFGDGAVDKLTVIYADAQVHHVDQFQAGDELEINAAGGGGTAFSDTFERIEQEFSDARAVIYLTDLYVNDFGENPGMPVLWGVYGRNQDFDRINVPFGELINISV